MRTLIASLKKIIQFQVGETGARWSINFIFENIYNLSFTKLNKLRVIWLGDI